MNVNNSNPEAWYKRPTFINRSESLLKKSLIMQVPHKQKQPFHNEFLRRQANMLGCIEKLRNMLFKPKVFWTGEKLQCDHLIALWHPIIMQSSTNRQASFLARAYTEAVYYRKVFRGHPLSSLEDAAEELKLSLARNQEDVIINLREKLLYLNFFRLLLNSQTDLEGLTLSYRRTKKPSQITTIAQETKHD